MTPKRPALAIKKKSPSTNLYSVITNDPSTSTQPILPEKKMIMTIQKISRRILLITLAVIVLVSTTTTAFAPPATSLSFPTAATAATTTTITGVNSSTRLLERKWNFNEGQSPWGMKKNAETWNGRVAQLAFIWVFLQELVTGKGVFKGLEEGDFFFIANAGLFGVMVVGLTGFLAFKGDDDYTKA